MENYYEILGISRYASIDEIKQVTQQQIQLIKTAYETLADTEKRQAYEANPTEIDYYALLDADNSVTSTRLKLTTQEKLNTFKSIYQLLSEPSKREAYNASLDAEPSTDKISSPEFSTRLEPTAENDNPYAAPVTVMTDVMIDSEMELASRLSRFGAYFVDLTIYMIPLVFMLIIIMLIVEGGLPDIDSIEGVEGLMESPLGLTLLGGLVLGFIGILILNLVYLYRSGQTIGKKVLKIKIIRTDYTRAGLARIIFLRYLVMGLLGSIPSIGFITTIADYLMIFGKARRCIHDHVADTIVVKVK